MITEDYVSFEIAKLLKEKGFDWKCKRMFRVFKNSVPKVYDSPEWITNEDLCNIYQNCEFATIPTLQMAMKWLRKKHNLFIFLSTWLRHKDGTVQYIYEIRNLNDRDFETITESTSIEFDSPEKTYEAAIKYCLENLI